LSKFVDSRKKNPWNLAALVHFFHQISWKIAKWNLTQILFFLAFISSIIFFGIILFRSYLFQPSIHPLSFSCFNFAKVSFSRASFHHPSFMEFNFLTSYFSLPFISFIIYLPFILGY
jgi:hypothetical protein